MTASLDSSVLVAALYVPETYHGACLDLLRQPGLHMSTHVLAECFSTLTGGRLGIRMLADDVARALGALLPRLTAVNLTTDEYLAALNEARARGVRGGAIHDYLHLVAARKIGAEKFYTLNVADFRSFHRAGDPEIVHP